MRPSFSRLLRLTGLGVIGAVALGLVRSARPKPKPPATGSASWPPLVAEPEAAGRSGPVQFAEPAAVDDTSPSPTPAPTGWIQPDDGACPTSHPIKANAQSGIFHVPGGQSYDRTHAERCYIDAAGAEADGYRQAKR